MTTDPSTTSPGARPGDRWRRSLRDAAPPQALVEAVPERPRHLEPDMFRFDPDEEARLASLPSRRLALEALPEGGTVLDVGVGGGKSSLGLAARAGLIVGVDRSEEMMASFEASAAAAGVKSHAVLGDWPDVGADVEPVDVVVCHNACYGVEEIEAFLGALTTHARGRVVVEVSTEPPPAGIGPLWKAIHGSERRTRPVADDLQATLVAMGVPVEREDAVVPARMREPNPRTVAFMRRRLMVDEDRDAEIGAFLRTHPWPDRHVAALWWPGTGA